VLLACALLASGFTFSNAYFSPRNPERELRRVTRYIILHTTEAPGPSSLAKLRDCGEANFCVDLDGRIYRIVDHRRVAFHCGRSMWEGRSNIDDCGLGIEVVGAYNRDITPAQYQALKGLLAELKFYYRVSDERVLTHSMVAYGAPNKWFARSHRGRKRCGMLFANVAVRKKLGLNAQPRYDPDVRAGRLIVGDPPLARALFGSGRDPSLFFSHATAEAHANGTEGVQTLGVDGASAKAIAGDEAWSGTTIYIFRDGRFVRGCDLSKSQRDRLPKGTRMLVGFVAGGPITAARRANEICGARWRQPYTFFLLPGGVIKPGSEMDEGKIPSGAMIFYRS
jgi:hypothetical protein